MPQVLELEPTPATFALSPPPAPAGIDDCVEMLYDAVGDDTGFRHALGHFCGHFDATGAIYLLPPDEHSADTIAARNVPAAALTEYHSHFFAHDTWRLAAQARGLVVPGYVARGCDIVDPGALQLSYFWREFLQPYGIKDILTGVIPPADGEGDDCTIVSFHRGAAQPGWFAPKLVEQMRALMPHLGRALRMHRRIAPQVAVAHTLEGMFDQMDVPMLFVDRRGRLVRANRQADVLCQRAQTLSLGPGRLLMARTANGWQHLARALEGLAGAPTVRQMLLEEDGMPAVLTLRRVHGNPPGLAADDGADEVHAVVTLRATPAELLDAFAQHYALTPAEVRTARCVVDGLQAEEIAQQLGVKLSTVRTHIGHLLAKTGARRQTEFVARLRGGAPRASAR